MYLPNVYGSAFVVDGQHRLFGYAHSHRAENKDDKTIFSVLAYENLDNQLEAQMFVDINSQQKQVAKGLLDELKAILHRDASDFTSRTAALVSKLVQDLNGQSGSKLYGRVRLTGDRFSATRCLSITQLADPMLKHRIFGEARKGGQEVPGPLSDSNKGTVEGDEEKGRECLQQLFDFIAETGPTQYAHGGAPGGYLWTNTGVRPLIGVFAAALRFVAEQQQLDLDMYPPAQFMAQVCGLVKPVVLYFEDGDGDDARAFRDRTGMKGVTKNEFEMMRIIRAEVPEFNAPGLVNTYLSSTVDGTRGGPSAYRRARVADAQVYSSRTSRRVREGEDWRAPKVVEGRSSRKSQDGLRGEAREGPQAQRVPVAVPVPDQHRDIVMQPSVWSKRFEAAFTFGKKGNKDKKTMWMVDLNDIRNTTHHVIKGVCRHDEVEQVRADHRHVMDKLKIAAC